MRAYIRIQRVAQALSQQTLSNMKVLFVILFFIDMKRLLLNDYRDVSKFYRNDYKKNFQQKNTYSIICNLIDLEQRAIYGSMIKPLANIIFPAGR